ncbi:hypothetical protein [Natronorarus salvus]|uniref:hypothetical protein n=1 Tax=Natronorarus salvus TaxID=3117733 RepID=UPI002F267B87
MRPLLVVGLLCLGAGIVLVAGPTFGLSVVESDRGVTATVSDENGLVGLEESGETIDREGETTVLTLVNNAGEPIEEFDVRIDSVEGPVEVASLFDYPPIEPGERTSLTLSCDRGGHGDGEVTVVIERAATASLAVGSLTRTVPFEYDCTGPQNGGEDGSGGDVRFESLTAQATEQDGVPAEVTFEYRLDGAAEGVEFVVGYGNGQEDEVLAEENEGTITVALSTPGQRDYPLDVSGAIDGGEACEGTIEDDSPVEPCG